MFDKYFYLIHDNFHKHKWLVIWLLGIVTAAAVIGLRSISFDNNIELMLPRNDEVLRTINFLRKSHFSDKVVLSLKLESPGHTTQDLIQSVDRLVELLKPPLITDVVIGICLTKEADEIFFF